MKLIGLTGGIGSGKSTIGALFRTLNVPVYESDGRARLLMESDPDVIRKIKVLFGEDIYTSSGLPDRKRIASLVFKDPARLAELNAIIHPAVFADLLAWMKMAPQVEAPFGIQESAILFEENLVDRFDAVILVVAPESLRISRVMKRDGVSREQVLERVSLQMPDEEKIPRADYVIYNEEGRSLVRQVVDIRSSIIYSIS